MSLFSLFILSHAYDVTAKELIEVLETSRQGQWQIIEQKESLQRDTRSTVLDAELRSQRLHNGIEDMTKTITQDHTRLVQD